MFTRVKRTYFARAFLRGPGQSNRFGMNRGILGMGFFMGMLVMSYPLHVFSGNSLYFKALFWIFLVASAIGLLVSYSYGMKYLQGWEGEKYVHDELEPIIKDGYHILNAFPGDKFDIDFIVVGPTGVYAIEVKNPKKYAADDWIIYENGLLRIKSKQAKATIPLRAKDPIKQARHGADWLKHYLSDIRGRRFEHVKAVVLFPRFLVQDHIEPDLMVLNPKRFAYEHLPKAQQVLSPGDVTSILTALRARIKTFDDIEAATE